MQICRKIAKFVTFEVIKYIISAKDSKKER